MFAELIAHLLDAAAAYSAAVLASPRQLVAHVAVILAVGMVMVGALARTMLPLRWLAAGSNAGLIIYGALRPSLPTLLIAATLLPINLYRAFEVTRLTKRVRRAEAAAEQAGIWLKPYMKARKLRKGYTLFKKGDKAEHLYMLVDGALELTEISKAMEPGRIFGEIALFSPTGLRTMTARCTTACTVLQIHDSTVRQLYYQDPAFGFHLIGLLTERLSSDVERAQAAQVKAA